MQVVMVVMALVVAVEAVQVLLGAMLYITETQKVVMVVMVLLHQLLVRL